MPRETLNNTPTPIIEITSDEPPRLMKGKGRPVNGRVSVTTAMLINAWNVSQMVMPDANMKPKESSARKAILKPR